MNLKLNFYLIYNKTLNKYLYIFNLFIYLFIYYYNYFFFFLKIFIVIEDFKHEKFFFVSTII